MIRTYKYRLRPTKKQTYLLGRLFAQMQTVYNDALNERREAWKRSRRSVTYVRQWNRMRDERHRLPDEMGMLNATSIQQMLRRVDKAYRALYAGRAGHPRFKNAKRFRSVEYRPGDGVATKRPGGSLCPAMSASRFFLLGFLLLATSTVPATDSATVKRLFARPPREYATAPLWVWNDQLTDDQIRGTLRDLAGQGVRQAFVHPRPGLMTPYLSPEWFRLWRVALDEARRLDMNIWIYDENSYPSGFAGGWVPELMPESRGRGLKLAEVKTPPKWDTNLIAVLRVNGDGAEDVSARLKSGATLPEGRYVVATFQPVQKRTLNPLVSSSNLGRPTSLQGNPEL